MAFDIKARLAVARHGFLVIWPPDDVRREVNALRQRYDPRSQEICEAHVTLTRLLQDMCDADAEAQLVAIARSITPFMLRYGPLGSFLPYPCIWYAIEPYANVAATAEAFHQSALFVPGAPDAKPFVPHMTITEGFCGPTVNEALIEEIGRHAPGGEFLCDRIALIVPDESYRFEVRAEFALGG